MTVFIIVAIVIIAIIFFVNQSNEEKRKIEEQKKRQDRIKYQAAQTKKQEEEEEKRLALIQQKKLKEKKKLDEENRLEKVRLQKIEDEKYETFTIVVIGQSISKYTCVLKRQNNTYAYVERPETAFQLNASIKLLKDKANNFDWISETQHNKKQKEVKEQKEKEEKIARQNALQSIKNQQRNFSESNTNFSENIQLLQNQNNLNFSNIRRLSVNYVNQLSKETANKLHSELNSGVTIIETEGHLHKYIHAYGNMHQAKLLQSFQAIPNFFEVIDGKEIEIIDYGCGQGIGSIVFFEYLGSVHWGGDMNHRGWQCSIDKVILVEPSKLALKRASLNVKATLNEFDVDILAIHKTIENINLQDLETNESAIKFHIFSNILDVDDFNIEKFAEKINNTQQGINYFICVSPKFWEDGVHPRNLRLDAFMNYFQQRHNVSVISTRESNINSWKRYERVFNVKL